MTNGLFGGCFGHFNMSHHIKTSYILNMAGAIRSAADTIRIRKDLADRKRIRYDTLVHDLRFQNQE